MTTELIKYDAMLLAIDAAHRVDEVADIRHRARALELYAKQARNTDAERKAAQIRIRAEARTGELLHEVKRVTPQARGAMAKDRSATQSSTPYQEALRTANISPRSAHQYQSLAAVPRAERDRQLAQPGIPTTTGIINSHRAASHPVPHMPRQSLDLWGWIRDFERKRFADLDIDVTLLAMLPHMRDDLRRVLPLLILSLTEIERRNTQ